MRETKFIIIKDNQNRLKHFKSDYLHHCTIARDKGYSESDIVESGLFLDGALFILECINQRHLVKKREHYIGNKLNDYQDLRLQSFLKGRELESQLYYSKKPIYIDVENKTLKEGD